MNVSNCQANNISYKSFSTAKCQQILYSYIISGGPDF